MRLSAETIAIGAIVAGALAVGAGVAYEFEHPCLRYAVPTESWGVIGYDSKGMPVYGVTETRECLERGSR